MKRILIRHGTRYSFGAPVQLGPHTLLLCPREGHDAHASSALNIAPKAALTWRRDLFENVLGIAVFGAEPVTELAIAITLEVELYIPCP
jgi:hypothetical protein